EGFTLNYTSWWAHGETASRFQHEGQSSTPMEDDDLDGCTQMVMDAMGPTIFNIASFEPNPNSNSSNEQPSNPSAKGFYDMLAAADEPLWDGCQNYSKLQLISELLNWKSKNNVSEAAYNQLIPIIKKSLPPSLKESYVELSMLIPGKKSPGQNIDVFLKPLVEELITLYNDGIETYDGARKENFIMKAILLWTSIVETICKLENFFLLGFFDSMEHLVIHLTHEAILGGPVQYRWMFLYERRLGSMKRKIRNQAKVCKSSDDSLSHLKGLARGPLRHAWSYKGYFINGFKFRTKKYGEGRVTHNSGVCVKGACYNETECDFYGLLEEVIKTKSTSMYELEECENEKDGGDNADEDEFFQESEALIPTTSRSLSEIEEPVCLVIQGELELVNNNGDDTQTELSDEAEQSDEVELLENSDESDDDSDDISDD
nr:hypothetical protein [Tanacetum cinerariifolium]